MVTKWNTLQPQLKICVDTNSEDEVWMYQQVSVVSMRPRAKFAKNTIPGNRVSLVMQL